MSAVHPARPRRMGWPACPGVAAGPGGGHGASRARRAATPASKPRMPPGAVAPPLSGDNAARLACFDAWAGQQALAGARRFGSGRCSARQRHRASGRPQRPRQTRRHHAAATRIGDVARTEGCRDPQYSDLSRNWELESGSDCGTFSFRGYRPITVSVVASNSVNRQPTSPAVGHSATESTALPHHRNRIQLSVRTKAGPGAAHPGHPHAQGFGVVWLFAAVVLAVVHAPDLAPFRSTDHEPEIMYVYPTTAQLPFGWRWRYSGVGLVHQSNGQSNPLSRSWNRVYLMTGMELDNRWTVTGRLCRRLSESADSDDNPASATT